MPAINAHGEFTPTPENHMTPRPHPEWLCYLLIDKILFRLIYDLSRGNLGEGGKVLPSRMV